MTTLALSKRLQRVASTHERQQAWRARQRKVVKTADNWPRQWAIIKVLMEAGAIPEPAPDCCATHQADELCEHCRAWVGEVDTWSERIGRHDHRAVKIFLILAEGFEWPVSDKARTALERVVGPTPVWS